jgi:hypothetical protein
MGDYQTLNERRCRVVCHRCADDHARIWQFRTVTCRLDAEAHHFLRRQSKKRPSLDYWRGLTVVLRLL